MGEQEARKMEREFRIFLSNRWTATANKCKWCEQSIIHGLPPLKTESNYIRIEFSAMDKLFFHMACFQQFKKMVCKFDMVHIIKVVRRFGEEKEQ